MPNANVICVLNEKKIIHMTNTDIKHTWGTIESSMKEVVLFGKSSFEESKEQIDRTSI